MGADEIVIWERMKAKAILMNEQEANLHVPDSEGLKCLRMALWNEEQRRGISFHEMRAIAQAQSTYPS
jgi:hypothetical protein